MDSAFEPVIGLEVHCELKTKTKIFCSCKNTFGAPQNTCCCPVCMGLPGALPTLNAEALRLAVKAGIALNCDISSVCRMDRKNYFYPDLPKGYQISQLDYPVCKKGYVEITHKKIGITRIHIEEDAGKLIHDGETTLADFNRSGVPLIEIVSEPDIRSGDEAVEYLKNLRAALMYIDASDCKMNEGSLRCDINISLHRAGEPYGTRCEIKNLNSFRFVKKAIEYEIKRQTEILKNGGTVIQKTMRFDGEKTVPMREKENAEDYRYFPEPDIVSFRIDDSLIKKLKNDIPELPGKRKSRYMEDYELSLHDADMLTEEKEISDSFEEAIKHTKYVKKLANLIITDCFACLRPNETSIPIKPQRLSAVAELFGSGRINSGVAKKLILKLWEQDFDVNLYVEEKGLSQLCDEGILKGLIREATEENPKIIEDYKKGKPSAANSLMGAVMRKTGGRGNPEIVSRLIKSALEKL